MSLRDWVERRWYDAGAPAPLLLRPLAGVFGGVADARRRRLSRRAPRLPVPVIVVGNLSVGGTGKTPFTIWLVQRLREWGFRPGVISRGYGAQPPRRPYRVRADSPASEAGDEPLLIALRTGAPVAVDADRVAAARMLIAGGEIDVLVADDGLQHYRLARDLEICVVDGRRGFGNGARLPAGPLREPVTRLAEIPLMVVNGQGAALPSHPGRIDLRLHAERALALDGWQERALADWRGQRVHAVAGIGDPARFFATLRGFGIEPVEHPFPDHHAFAAHELQFGNGLPLLMTEKDAVKCRGLGLREAWAVPVDAVIDPAGTARVQQSCLVLPR